MSDTTQMDLCAELTLRIARLLQSHRGPEHPFTYWYFLPEFHKASWDEARDLLTNAPKPLVVAPLLEPGFLATWRMDVMGPTLRQAAEYHLDNQLSFYSAKLEHFGYRETDTLELRVPSGDLTLPVAEFRRWVREYVVGGVSIHKTHDPHVGRLWLRPPGGGGPPIGFDPSLPIDDHHHH